LFTEENEVLLTLSPLKQSQLTLLYIALSNQYVNFLKYSTVQSVDRIIGVSLFAYATLTIR